MVAIHRAYNPAAKPSSSRKTSLKQMTEGLENSPGGAQAWQSQREPFSIPDPQLPKALPTKADLPENTCRRSFPLNFCSPTLRKKGTPPTHPESQCAA